MRFIYKSTELNDEFSRLLIQYRQYYWSVAWATSKSPFFNKLIQNKSNIQKLLVGIHFYQTHPDFIQEFLNFQNARFIQQPAGTFHPKVYVFYNSDSDWEILLGSANFTKEGFSNNTEATVLMSSQFETIKTLKDSLKMIEISWKIGKTFTRSDLDNYIKIWQTQQSKLKSLSGKYAGEKPSSQPLHLSKVATRTWQQFMFQVRTEPHETTAHRIRVLQLAKSIFNSGNHFKKFSDNQRKFIAGIPNTLNEDSWLFGVFGSMKGAGIYKNRIIQNDSYISRALDQIPLSGSITKTQYEKYIELFQMAFLGTQLENANNLATATRLLSMKRSDIFICFASKNRSKLCKDFGIKQSNMDFVRYWDDVILRIQDCNWWINPQPRNQTEQLISDGRAAFLDSIYYNP